MTTFSMSKYLWIIIWVLVGAVIALTAAWQYGLIARDRYLALYLQTGDIYFGKQVSSLFSREGFTLQNPWFFQKGEDGNLTLVPMSNVAWHPTELVHFNEKQIIFWTYLDSESPVAQAIAGKISGNAPPPVQNASGTPSIVPPSPAEKK